MHALVGADHDRPMHMHQRIILACRQRLLDQRDAGVMAGIEIGFQVVRRPRLIGIDDQLGFGAAWRTALMRLMSSSLPSLIFSSGR